MAATFITQYHATMNYLKHILQRRGRRTAHEVGRHAGLAQIACLSFPRYALKQGERRWATICPQRRRVDARGRYLPGSAKAVSAIMA